MKKIIIHPLLFALYPVLTLYLQNAQQLSLSVTCSTFLVVLGLTALLWWLLSKVIKDSQRAAFIISVLLILFFMYGHIYNLLSASGANWQGVLFVIEGVVLIGAAYLALKSKCGFSTVTTLLNIFSAVLVATTLSSQLYLQNFVARSDANVSSYLEAWDRQAQPAALTVELHPALPYLPDIYYIILDGYGREDILADLYQYDNSSFLDALRERGFYVADASTSNYGQTALSLSSSLNFTYLDDLVNNVGSNSRNVLPLQVMIRQNRVFQHLRRAGYRIVTFSSGFPFTEITDVDQYHSPPQVLNAFQNELISTTPLPLLLALTAQKTQYDLQRERLRYTLSHSADVAKNAAPTFTFAHILAPHPPFVFTEDGQPLPDENQKPYTILDGDIPPSDRAEYLTHYRDQLKYISGQVLATVDDILVRSPEPPLIILQGDHGPGMTVDWTNIQNTNFRERMSIFEAYYFPDQNYAMLYPGISPVNTFRVILNQYFGTHYPLLEDKSFLSSLTHYYSFFDVTGNVRTRP
jgi:hypothetical protein